MKNYQNKSVDKTNIPVQSEIPSVSDYMTKKLITFTKDTDINLVIATLLENRISGAPVLDEQGKVIGLIDDKDCLKILFGNAYNRLPDSPETVSKYMSNIMKSISVDQNILEVASVFVSSPYKRLMVLDEHGKLVGQISRRDVLRAIKEMK